MTVKFSVGETVKVRGGKYQEFEYAVYNETNGSKSEIRINNGYRDIYAWVYTSSLAKLKDSDVKYLTSLKHERERDDEDPTMYQGGATTAKDWKKVEEKVDKLCADLAELRMMVKNYGSD